MVTWQPSALDREIETPLHVQIVEQFRGALADGILHAGDAIPPEPQLATLLGVARATLRLALRRLDNDGLVVRRRGWGTRVSATADRPYTSASVPRATAESERDELLADVLGLRRQVEELNR